MVRRGRQSTFRCREEPQPYTIRTFHYRYSDWLGSSRFSSTTSRTKFSDDAYAPYGENYAESGTVDPSFTGNDQDTVSGTYDFLFREYNANQGRWISPDPAGLGAVDPTNPQSWNRYAYVANTPLSAVDPLGLCDPYGGNVGCTEGGAAGDPFMQFVYFVGYVHAYVDLVAQTRTQIFEGENSVNFPVPPLLTTLWTDVLGLPSLDLSNCLPICDVNPANNGTIRSDDKIHCAAAVANRLSLANQPSLPGPSNPNALDKALAYGANAVFGNTFSGIVDFYDTARTATNAAPVYFSLATNGVRMGLPGGGVLSKGAVGTAQDAVLQGAFSNLGIYRSVTAANVLGLAKIGYDLATFGYGLYQCTNF